MFVSTSFGVYVDSETSRFHFDQFQKLKFRYELYNRDVDSFVAKPYQARVAAFHVAFPLNSEWVERLDRLYDATDRIFVFCSELHERTVAQLISLDRPKVTLYICGVIDHNFQHAEIRPWMDWFHTSSEFYARTNPGFLDSRVQPYAVKPKSFDVLLGNQRPHRDFVCNYVNNANLQEHVVMTYVYYSHLSLINNNQFILEDDNVEYYPDRDYNHSVSTVKYHGRDMTISQIVPLNVYNQTAYTLVAETNAFNSFNFYTEKIVKPMLARRLFIVVAGRNYLKNLQNMGFRTFSDVIDESYDSIDNDQERWTAAMNQLTWLDSQPQQQILDQIKPIAEHNYRRIAEKNWYAEFSQQLESDVAEIVQLVQN